MVRETWFFCRSDQGLWREQIATRGIATRELMDLTDRFLEGTRLTESGEIVAAPERAYAFSVSGKRTPDGVVIETKEGVWISPFVGGYAQEGSAFWQAVVDLGWPKHSLRYSRKGINSEVSLGETSGGLKQ